MGRVKVEYDDRFIEGEIEDVLKVINQFHMHVKFKAPIQNNPPKVQQMMRDLSFTPHQNMEVINDGFECNQCGGIHPTPMHEEPKV